MPDSGTPITLLGRRSDRTQNPADSAKNEVRYADIPRLGRSESRVFSPANKQFPGLA